ncbi:MAG: TolC family protein, partial [Desulfobacterales bacterium]|nr:TolC family protein [Desulfobacterales bacterium]
MIFFKCHVSERLLKIALSFSVLILFLSVSQSFAQDDKNSYTLSEAISYALMNNPGVTVSRKDVEIENYNIREAKGNRYPKIDIRGGAVRSYYAMPVTPISGPPTEGGFPEFDETIYDMGFAFS